MIPFAIQGFMIPVGLALAPFGKGCRAVIEPDLIVPLCMIIVKPHYIIINSEVNEFVFGRSFFFDMIHPCIILYIGFSDARVSYSSVICMNMQKNIRCAPSLITAFREAKRL